MREIGGSQKEAGHSGGGSGLDQNENRLRASRIIFAAMMFGAALTAAIGIALQQMLPDLPPFTLWIFLGVAAVDAGVAFWLRARIAGGAGPGARPAQRPTVERSR